MSFASRASKKEGPSSANSDQQLVTGPPGHCARTRTQFDHSGKRSSSKGSNVGRDLVHAPTLAGAFGSHEKPNVGRRFPKRQPSAPQSFGTLHHLHAVDGTPLHRALHPKSSDSPPPPRRAHVGADRLERMLAPGRFANQPRAAGEPKGALARRGRRGTSGSLPVAVEDGKD